jgi:chemotaxis protein MotB
MSYDQNLARALRPPSQAPWVLLFLTVAGAAGGGAWLYDQMGKAKATAAESTTRAEAAETKRAALAPKVEKLEAEKAELVTAKEELERNVEAKTGELAQLKGTADKLQERMKDEIARGDIRLSESGGRLRVDLVDKLLFDSGEAQISKRGEGVLGRVGAVLAQIDDKQIQVSGHTDNQPVGEKIAAQFPSNWELSAARAINVVRFLAEKASVPPQRLVASGYGEWNPIASNKSSTGRARNRRIEILLTPALAPKMIGRAKLKAAATKDQATKEHTKDQATKEHTKDQATKEHTKDQATKEHTKDQARKEHTKDQAKGKK